jgi:magnesium transporter
VHAPEHAVDLARLSGYLHQGERAREAAQERVLLRFWHRLPWLIVGLLGAIVAARVVAGYERALEQDVMIAFFIPGIVYLADAVGTQTEAVVIRGLSLGASIRQMAARELATGVALGITLGAVFYPFALLLGTSSELAAAVSISLAAACAIANLIALLVPWAVQGMGRDPAFGSGPLATVIQDIVSILVYFAVVSAMVLQ